ncbi:MAG: carbohydrate ABC transporter permease [Chloroflexota bacterium]
MGIPLRTRQRAGRPGIKFSAKTVLLWAILLPIGIVIVMPVWFMVAKAFTPEINQIKWPIVWVPDPFTTENFEHILADKTLPIMRWLMNSLLVTGVGTAAVLFLSALSAYAFARLEFPGRDVIFFILIISLMIPAVATFIPTFLVLRDMKLLDNYLSLWLPAAASVGGIFFLRQQFFAIPRELEDAAVVDGAGPFRVFWQICLPLVRSALVAQAILTALMFWNDLYWPLVTMSTRELLTMPVGLLVLSQGSYIQRGLAFAGGFMATVPPLIVYAIFQRQIIEGMTTAGLAGR